MLFNLPYLAPLILLLSFRSHAQNLSDLPSCAQSSALSAIGSTGCKSSDFACLCKDNSFINAALAESEKQCSQADLQKVIAFAQQICGSVGVSLSVSATAEGSGTPSPITNTNTPTPTPSPAKAVITGTTVSPVDSAISGTTASPVDSAITGTTVSLSTSSASATTGQASATAAANAAGTATSDTSGRDAMVGLRGIMWSAAVVGCWLFGFGV